MTIIDKAGREGQRKLAKLELGLKFGSEEMIHEKLELVIIFGGNILTRVLTVPLFIQPMSTGLLEDRH